jgi:hypothetical protein
LTIPLTAATDATNVVAVGTNTTVSVPSNTTTTVCVITGPNGVSPVPNPNYAGTITLKGVAGDTGVPISGKYPTVLEWDVGTAPASFVLNASVATTVELWFA